MADSIGGSSGGGIHPGAPIIWPTGKSSASSSSSVSSASNVESAGQVKGGVSTGQTGASAAAGGASSASSAASSAATVAPSFVRAMTPGDLISQLLSLGLQPSTDMRELAGKMLQSGLELSGDNFQKLTTLLRGSPDAGEATKDAAIQTVLKGLDDSPKAMTSLAGLLSSAKQQATQMQQVSAAMAKLQAALAPGKLLLSPNMQAMLSGLVAQFDQNLKDTLRESTDAEGLEKLLAKSGLLSDAEGVKQLLDGVMEQLRQGGQLETPGGRELAEVLRQAQEALEGLKDNVLGQAVLSKDAARTDTSMNQRFIYNQFPNPMTFPPSTAELLIKRDENQDKAPVNPNKTRVILKLQTEALGEVTIFIDVENNKVWYTFNTETDETRDFVIRHTKDLQDRMKVINYDLTGMHAIKRKIDLKRYVMPRIDFDSFTRVSTEV